MTGALQPPNELMSRREPVFRVRRRARLVDPFKPPTLASPRDLAVFKKRVMADILAIDRPSFIRRNAFFAQKRAQQPPNGAFRRESHPPQRVF